jgi:hypothetical protein
MKGMVRPKAARARLWQHFSHIAGQTVYPQPAEADLLGTQRTYELVGLKGSSRRRKFDRRPW